MTTRWLDSFDTTTSLSQQYESQSGGVVNSTFGRNSTNGVTFTRGGTNQTYVRKNLGASGTTVTMGFAFKRTSGATAGRIAALRDSGTEQVSLRIETTGELSVYNAAGSLIARSTTLSAGNLLTNGQQYHVEWQSAISDAAGTAIVKVNGVTWINGSSLDTKNTANAFANQAELGDSSATNYTSTFGCDDWYVNDQAGSDHNTFEGDKRVVACLVAANGASGQQFTPLSGTNASNVDDTNPDDDTTYNSSSTVGHKDHFDMANLPAGATGNPVVAVKARWRKDDATVRALRAIVKSGGTTGNGATTTMNTTYATSFDVFENDPSTAAAWTVSAVNAMEVGYEVVT